MAVLDDLTGWDESSDSTGTATAPVTPAPTETPQDTNQREIQTDLQQQRQALNGDQRRQTWARMTGAQFAMQPMAGPKPPQYSAAPIAEVPANSTFSKLSALPDEPQAPAQDSLPDVSQVRDTGPRLTRPGVIPLPVAPIASDEKTAAVAQAVQDNGAPISQDHHAALTADVDYRHAQRKLGGIVRSVGMTPDGASILAGAIDSGDGDTAHAAIDAHFSQLYATPEASSQTAQGQLLRDRLDGMQRQAHKAADGMLTAQARANTANTNIVAKTPIPGVDDQPPAQAPAPEAPSMESMHAAITDAQAGKKPYQFDEKTGVSFQPDKMADGLRQAVKDGLIDPDYAKQHEQQFQAAQDKYNDLQKAAGGAQALKALLHGGGIGAAFLAGSMPGAKGGAALGALVPGAGETGISEFIGGALGGLATGSIAAWGAHKALDKLADYSDTVRSLNASAELHPVLDSAGQLIAMSASAPKAISNVYKASQLARAAAEAAGQNGTTAAAKLAAKIVGSGAAGGAAFETVVRPVFDYSKNAVLDQLGMEHDAQVQSPTLQSIITNTALGILTAGHNIEFKTYSTGQVASILTRAQIRNAAGVPLDAPMTPEQMTSAAQKIGLSEQQMQGVAQPLSKGEIDVFGTLGEQLKKMKESGNFEGVDVSNVTAKQAVIPKMGDKEGTPISTTSIETNPRMLGTGQEGLPEGAPAPAPTEKPANARVVTPGEPTTPTPSADQPGTVEPPPGVPAEPTGPAAEPQSTAAPESSAAEVAPDTQAEAEALQKTIADKTALLEQAKREGNSMGIPFLSKEIADAQNRLNVIQSAPATPVAPPPGVPTQTEAAGSTSTTPETSSGKTVAESETSSEVAPPPGVEQAPSEVATESDESIAARTTPGAGRDAAITARRKAANTIAATAEDGDTLVTADGDRIPLQKGSKRQQEKGLAFHATTGGEIDVAAEIQAGGKIEKAASGAVTPEAIAKQHGIIYQGETKNGHAFKDPETNGNLTVKASDMSPEHVGEKLAAMREKFAKTPTVTPEQAIESATTEPAPKPALKEEHLTAARDLAAKEGRLTVPIVQKALRLNPPTAAHLIERMHEEGVIDKDGKTIHKAPTSEPPNEQHEATKKLASAALKLHSDALKTLGHPDDFDYGPVKSASGIATDIESKRIRLDIPKLSKAMESMDKKTAAQWIKRAVAHEIIHVATLKYAEESPANQKKLLSLLDDKELMAHAENAYGKEWEGLNDFAKAAEAARMLVEGPEELTEASYKFLGDFIKWLKQKLGKLSNDTRELIQGIEAKMGKFRKEQKTAIPKEESKAPAVKEEKSPATGQLYVEIGSKRVPFKTLNEASAMYEKARDATGAGASQIPPVNIVDETGKPVAHISYNGKVWESPRGKWTKDTKLLFTPGESEAPATRPPIPPSKTPEALAPMPPKTTTPEPPKTITPQPPVAKKPAKAAPEKPSASGATAETKALAKKAFEGLFAATPEGEPANEKQRPNLLPAKPDVWDDARTTEGIQRAALAAATPTPEQIALPKDKETRLKFIDLIDSMEQDGIKTPEKVAAFLDEISPNLRKYAQSLWDMMGAGGAVQRGTHDWPTLFQGEQKPASKAPAKVEETDPDKPRRSFKFRGPVDEHFAADPIVQEIADQGGLMSRSTAQKNMTKEQWTKHKGEWDDVPSLAHPTHNQIYKPNGLTPDEMAMAMIERGLLPEGASSPELWKKLGEISKSANRMRQQQSAATKEVKEKEQQTTRFDKDAREQQPGTEPIAADQLHVDDIVDVNGEKLKVVAIDPDTHEVELDDHERYGVQQVKDGDVIYGQLERPAESGDDLFSTEEPPKAAEPSALPTLRPGEKGTSDLFQGDDAPFNLAGEAGVDWQRIADEKAKTEKDSAEAKAKQDRDQLDIFAPKIDVAPKEQPHDEPTGSSLETGGTRAGTGDARGESGVQAEPDATREDGGRMDAARAEREYAAPSGPLSADVPSALTGGGRTEPIQEPAPGVSGRTSGDEQPAGSRRDHVDGKTPDPGTADDAAGRLTIPGSTDTLAPSGGDGGGVAEIQKAAPALQPEQAADVAFIEKRLLENKKPGVLLTNGTGTGKTFSGLGSVKRFLDRGAKHILILAPSDKVVGDWIDTAKDHFGIKDITQLGGITENGAGNRVVVTTYANFGQNDSLVKRPWDKVVTDETHYLSQDKDGNVTNALRTFRALTYHPEGVFRRVDMMEPEATKRLSELLTIDRKNHGLTDAQQQERTTLRAKRDAAEATVRAEMARRSEAGRPKALFLSATPFAYHFSLDAAEGYLFDYPPEPPQRGYNTPSARSLFYMDNFGYRMRTGKLTKPENAVATGILERRFAESLKKSGAMSGRALVVPHDYMRHFVLTQSELGGKLDAIMAEMQDKPMLRPLLKKIGLGDYLQRRYLLEAMKAREAVERIHQHIVMGRKVIVFHDYKKGGARINPLRPIIQPGEAESVYQPDGAVNVNLGEAFESLKRAFPDFEQTQKELDGLHSPLDLFAREFPDALIFNGDIPKGKRREAVAKFNTSNSKWNVILVQRASGKEGISLHDTDGTHQRVFIDLGIPGRPTDSIQSEGRGYRVGVKSNFPIEYLVTGTNFERWTFAQTIAQRSSTAENLAMGENARRLLQSFATGFNDAAPLTPNKEQGVGGKEMDRAEAAENQFRNAVALYYTNAKKTSRSKSQEGIDYFPTPEPVGFKMVEWSGVKPGEKILEPSAGHGAIARFFPDATNRHAVEPSNELAGRLALNATDTEVHNIRFEDYHLVNKFDAITSNSPWGVGGKTAIEHLQKAALHLNEGGRIVALIPSGGMADKRFEKWMESDDAKGIHLRADILLPAVAFERAGTGAMGRIVVLDKYRGKESLTQHSQRDLRDISSVKELFDRIENMSVPDRAPVEKAVPAPAPAPTSAQQLLSGSGGILPKHSEVSQVRDTQQQVPQPQRESTWSPAEFKHTKTGAPIFVAKTMRRLSDGDYKAALSRAKGLGGYYSSFKGSGAIPGFHFKTAEARDSFLGTGGELGSAKPESGEELGAANPAQILRHIYDKGVQEIEAARDELKLRGQKEKIAYGTDAVSNLANYHGQQAANSIKLDLPEKKDREAMPFIIEAAGDAAKLQQFKADIAASSDPKLAKKFEPIIDHAIADQPRLTKAGKNHADIMAKNVAELKANGIDVGEVENYVTRKLDAPDAVKDALPNPMFSTGSGQGSSPRYFTKGRSFETLADAIKAGYPPISTDIADLDAHRIEAAKRMILQKQMFDKLKLTPSPTNGEPIIGDMQKRKLLNGETEMTVPRGYSIVQAGGTPLVIHNDFANVFRDLFGSSALRQTTVGRAAIKTAAVLKHGTLAIDTFHIGRMLLKMAAAGGGGPVTTRGQRIAWNLHKGRALLEYSDADLGRAVSSGDITQQEADYAKDNRAKVEKLMQHGMNVGRVADNLMEQAKLHLPILSTLNDWIFGKLSRSAMLQSALVNLERNLKDPNLSTSDAYRQTAREMNEIFGNLQNQGILKNKTLQDISRLIFLAPNWTESQFRNEARSYAQAVKAAYNTARGRGFRVGNSARIFAAGFVGLLVANQIINFLSRGKTTFQNPEDGHKLDAWIPGGKRGFWFDPLEIAGEYAHAAAKYTAQHENPVDVATHIASNKLSPLARGLKEGLSGRDYAGRHFLSNADRLRAAVTDMVPIPLISGAFFEKDPRAPLGYRVTRQPGSFEKQLLQSVGAKLTAAQSPRTQMFEIAQPFRADRGRSDTAGEYTELRRAIDNDQLDNARSEIEWLLDRGKNMNAITSAMGIRKGGQIAPELFAGSAEREKEMIASLTPKELEIYQQAQVDHLNNALKFLKLVKDMAPMGPQPKPALTAVKKSTFSRL